MTDGAQPTSPLIRLARREDAAAAGRLEQDNLGSDGWPFGLVAQGVAGEVPTTQWWVAELGVDPGGGDLCGHAVVSVAAEIAELQRISVTPAQRRTGLATALLAAVASYSAQQGAERLLLEVRVDNEAARAFYAACGFIELARRARYYADGADAVVLELELGQDPDPSRPTENSADGR